MRFGITILPDQPWATARPCWQAAEQLGFDHAWTYDHLVWGGLPESPWYATMPTLTAAAMVTSTIGLGTFVTSPNFRHPMPLLRDVIGLDDISDGRFLCGVGSGGDLDSGVLGGEPLTLKQRMDRFVEFTELFDELTRRDHVTFEGEYLQTRDARTLPGPVRPRVPLLIAANAPRGQRLAARLGDGWITYGPKTSDPDQWWAGVSELAQRMDASLATAGRADEPFARYLSLDGGRYSLTGVDHFAEQVERAAGLGFTDVVTHWPRASEPYRGSVEVLEQVCAQVLPRWRSGQQ